MPRFSPASIRRYLVPVLLLAPLIFLCGKLLLTPVSRSTSWWEYNRVRVTMNEMQISGSQERGWRWGFAGGDGRVDLGVSLALLLADIAVLLPLVEAFGVLLPRL